MRDSLPLFAVKLSNCRLCHFCVGLFFVKVHINVRVVGKVVKFFSQEGFFSISMYAVVVF